MTDKENYEFAGACPVALAKPAKIPNPPSHKLFRVVKAKNGGNDVWTEIAVCWPNTKGGFSIKMSFNETLAPGGDYVMMPNKPRPSQK